DDYLKVVNRRNLGLTTRAKLGLQIVASIFIAIALIAMQTYGMYSTKLMVPFFKQYRPDLVIGHLEHTPHLWMLAFVPFMRSLQLSSWVQATRSILPTALT